MKLFQFIIVLILVWNSQVFAENNFEKLIERKAKIDNYVQEAPLFFRDKSLPAIRKLDHLKDERVIKEPNPHIKGEPIEFRTLLFEGLEIYGSLSGRMTLSPIKISIADSRWKILDDLNVGSSGERIEKVLGKPTKESGNLEQYCGETDCVNFHIKDAKIFKVEFNYYLD